MKTSFKRLLSLLLLLSLPAVVLGQFTFTTNSDGSLNISQYTGSGGAVVIPSTTNAYPITSIGFEAFSGSSLTSVTIGTNVTTIGSHAFYYCLNLTSATIPDSVLSIGVYAFYRCPSLSSLTIGNGVTSIGQGAFYNCTSLTNITIPNRVANIDLLVFAGCTNLTSVTLGDRVTYIASAAFYDCTSLTSITIPNGVTYIGGTALSGGPAAFQGCISLTNITIGTNVTFIGSAAFTGCSSLTSVTLPNSVTNIGLQAFAGCTNVMAITVETNNIFYSSVAGVLFDKGQSTLIQYPLGNGFRYYVIPNSVTNIGSYAFANDTSLTSVTIPDSVTSISQGAFNSCISLTSVSIGTNVTTIGQGAFGGCPNLTSVTIPDSVIGIGNWTFSGCTSLTNATFGNGVTSMGYGAIDLCSRLTSIYFTGNAPSLSSSIEYAGPFYGDTATIYYLPGTTGWSTPFGGLQAVLWLPQVQSSDASFGVRTNQFGFNINWASGMVVMVQACTNLANSIWSPISTNTLTGGSFYFSDPKWTNYPARFYRLRSP